MGKTPFKVLSLSLPPVSLLSVSLPSPFSFLLPLHLSLSFVKEMKLLIIFEALSQVEKVCAMSYQRQVSRRSLMDRVANFDPHIGETLY